MKSFLTTFFVLAFVMLAFAPAASADGTCTNSYGTSVDCPTDKIMVDKDVRHPTNLNLFLDNLTSNNQAYSPGDEVEYKITVTNTSGVTYNKVTVTDILPTGLVFKAGPGTYNSATRTLTYTIENLKPGSDHANTARFTATVKETAFFNNEALTCSGDKVVNWVKAEGPNGQKDEDTASLCVQTKVLGVTTLPVAGFEDFMTVPFMIVAALGMFLIINSRRALS